MTLYYPTEKNAVQKTLDAALSAGVTSAMTLNGVTGIQNKPGVCVIDRVDSNGTQTPTKREYVAFTGVSGQTLTGLTRNADAGSTDQDHGVGAIVEFVSDVLQIQGIIDIANAVNITPGNAGNLMTSTGTAWESAAAPVSVLVTAAPGSDHTASGMKITLTAHDTQAFGDVCFINADGEAQLGDADAIATASCVAMCVDATIAANASGNYLLMGIARDDTWNWTVGGLIYLTVTGTTGNTLSQTAPTGTDDVVQILGVATHANRMIFNPQLVQVELV